MFEKGLYLPVNVVHQHHKYHFNHISKSNISKFPAADLIVYLIVFHCQTKLQASAYLTTIYKLDITPQGHRVSKLCKNL